MNMNLRVMRLIAAFTDAETRGSQNAQSRISPALRLVVCILTILLCSLSRNAFYTVCVIAVLLMVLAMMPAKAVRRAAEKLPLPVLMTALLMLPAVFLGSPRSLVTVTMKVFCAILCLSLLNEKASWKELTGALERFHAPELFIMTLDTTVRFFVLLGRWSSRMLEAISLRRVGEKNWKNAGMGGVLGTTWLKSQRMVQASTEAMVCRCFDGTYKKTGFPKETTKQDRQRNVLANAVFALVIPALIAGFVLTQKAV